MLSQNGFSVIGPHQSADGQTADEAADVNQLIHVTT